MIYFLALALLSLPGCFLLQNHPGKEVILKVNSCSLTTKEFAEQLATQLQSHTLTDLKNPVSIEQAKKSIERDFIFNCLVQEYAEKAGLSVSEEALQQELSTVEKQYPDRTSFLVALKEQGMDLEAYKKKVKISLLQKMLAENLSKDLNDPSEEQVQSYYDDHRSEFSKPEGIRVRQILVETEPEAQRITKELKANKSFKELAERFSLAPEGPEGGEVGWVYHGSANVFEGAFRLKVGQRSNPIKSPFGYHIVEVLEKKPEGKQPLSAVKEKIIWTLRENQRHARFTVWLEQQIKAAKILKDQNYIDHLKVETKGGS